MTNKKTILIIDDDEIFLDVLGRALTRRGYFVVAASTAKEAAASCERHQPSKAILDLKLERGSGLTVLPQLKIIKPDIDVLILTGYSSVSTAVEAIKMGAKDYLCKPADIEEILSVFSGKRINIVTTGSHQTPPSVDRLAWEHIQKVLLENKGNVSATARILGMHRRTLQRKLLKRPVKQ